MEESKTFILVVDQDIVELDRMIIAPSCGYFGNNGRCWIRASAVRKVFEVDRLILVSYVFDNDIDSQVLPLGLRAPRGLDGAIRALSLVYQGGPSVFLTGPRFPLW